jgi:hypothetical protein
VCGCATGTPLPETIQPTTVRVRFQPPVVPATSAQLPLRYKCYVLLLTPGVSAYEAPTCRVFVNGVMQSEGRRLASGQLDVEAGVPWVHLPHSRRAQFGDNITMDIVGLIPFANYSVYTTATNMQVRRGAVPQW